MHRLTALTLAVLFAASALACNEEVVGSAPVLDDPTAEPVTDPSFLCTHDPGSWVTLTGEDFSPLVIDAISREEDFDAELPSVTLSLAADPTGAPTDQVFAYTLESLPRADSGDIRWIDGSTLQFRIADEMEFPPGVYDLVVTNPNGESSRADQAFGVLPRPILTDAIPDTSCVAQGDRELVLVGEHFLVGDGESPTILIDDASFEVVDVDNCEDLAPVFGGRQLCQEVTALIDEGALDPGTYMVGIQNPEPADCQNLAEEDAIPFTVVAPPMVSAVSPTPICGEQLDYADMRVDGEGFVVLRNSQQYPAITVGDSVYTASGAEGCTAIDASSTLGAETCDALFFTIPADDQAAALSDGDRYARPDVQVENPDPVGCFSEEEMALTVVPPPSISEMEPSPVCALDGQISVVLTGFGFLEIGDALPEVVIGADLIPADSLDGCSSVENDGPATGSCDQLTFTLDADLLDATSLVDLAVINPESAACTTVDDDTFFVAGPPIINNAAPNGICEDDSFDGVVTLFGSFYFEADNEPTLTLNGDEIDIDEFQDCSTVSFGDLDLQSCSRLRTIIGGDLDAESFVLEVTGHLPASCGSDSFEIARFERPVINAVIPERLCSAGGTLEIQGENFSPDAEVLLDGIPASTLTVSADGTSATATFDGPLPTGFSTISFVNPGNCGEDFETQIRVYDGPLPIFVDPTVVFDEMRTQVTIYAAGLFGGSIDEVELIHPDGTTTSLDYTVDPDRPQIIQAVVPEGLLSAGETSELFGVRLTDNLACANEADDLLTITSELTVAVESIDPPFGAADQPTAVVIEATDPLDPDDGLVQFEAIPRVYLNPSDPGAGDNLAREIQAIQFLDPTELNGVVREGLPVGLYDLIVVNPDGAVGVLPESFLVTDERPPLIDAVSPGSWTNDQSALEVIIEGQNFRDGLEVQVFCRDRGDTTTVDEDDLTQPNSITVVDVESDEVVLSVNTNNLDHLSACYLRLTNDDSTFDEYAPITVTNPAGKFMEFNPSPNAFDTPRRGNVAFSGAPTRTARYLYVVGGDDGEEVNAFTSGEFASLDRFGAPRAFQYLPYDLPSGRTFSHAERIDDFVYLVSGSDEGMVSDEILRAQVLNPLDAPSIVGVDLIIDDEEFFNPDDPGPDPGDGLEKGVYYYRVSAVYTDQDPANPLGESLASEPQPISIPIDGLTVTISWTPPPMINHDILEYRVYRSVNPDDPYGNESLIATVDASETSYTDDGSDTPIDGDNPLPLGSLGMWHHIASLQTARVFSGVAFARNPANPDQFHLYAIGGEDSAGDALADYEFITIDVGGFRVQDVTAQAAQGELGGDPMLLPSPRTYISAARASESNASNVAMIPPQIFVFGGLSDTTTNTSIKITTVLETGHLDQWTTFGPTQRMSGGDRYGNASSVVNNNLVYIGGSSTGTPTDAGYHTEILCDISGSCPPATIPPNFENLSNLGMIPRAWMGYVAFRGFYYLAGGNTSGPEPTNTVDYSVAGGAP